MKKITKWSTKAPLYIKKTDKNYQKHLTFNNLSIFLLSIYPLALALGSFVSELLNFFIIITFLFYVSKDDIIKII